MLNVIKITSTLWGPLIYIVKFDKETLGIRYWWMSYEALCIIRSTLHNRNIRVKGKLLVNTKFIILYCFILINTRLILMQFLLINCYIKVGICTSLITWIISVNRKLWWIQQQSLTIEPSLLFLTLLLKLCIFQPIRFPLWQPT